MQEELKKPKNFIKGLLISFLKKNNAQKKPELVVRALKFLNLRLSEYFIQDFRQP